jgi:hypothetical protein
MDASSAGKSLLNDENHTGNVKHAENIEYVNSNALLRLFAFFKKTAFNVIKSTYTLFGIPVFSFFKNEENLSKQKNRENTIMSDTSIQAATEDCYAIGNSVIWLNLDKYPDAKQVNKDFHFCLKYEKDSEEELVSWIKKSRSNFSLLKRPLTGITIFVRFSELKPGESIRLTRKFGNAGAIISNYSENTRFEDAVANLNTEILGARNNAREYSAKRNKMIRNTSAPN